MQRRVEFKVNGQKVVGILHSPEKENMPAIIMIHSFKGNKDEHGRFVKAAERFCEEGFCVLRIDCRGTGESDCKFKEITIETEVEDMLTAIEFIKNYDIDPNKIGALGLSLGGEIVILGTLRSNLKSIVLWAPVTSSEKWRNKFTPEDIEKVKTKGELTVYSPRTGKPWIIGKELVETATGIEVENLLEKLKCSVLIIQGDKDTSITVESSKQAIEKIKTVKELKIIKGADHYFFEQIDEVIELSLNWFKEHL